MIRVQRSDHWAWRRAMPSLLASLSALCLPSPILLTRGTPSLLLFVLRGGRLLAGLRTGIARLIPSASALLPIGATASVARRRWSKFIGRKLPIAISVQRFERLRRILHLFGGNDAVVIRIQGNNDRAWRRTVHASLRSPRSALRSTGASPLLTSLSSAGRRRHLCVHGTRCRECKNGRRNEEGFD